MKYNLQFKTGDTWKTRKTAGSLYSVTNTMYEIAYRLLKKHDMDDIEYRVLKCKNNKIREVYSGFISLA